MQTVTAGGLDIGERHPPRIMGVLNLSAESPYEPSVFEDPGEAAAYADELIDDGADIVDVGLESANKRFDVLSADEELERLDRAIETLDSVSGDAVFSIETRYADVAEAAIDAGYELVNDICGFADPDMPEVCEAYDVPAVKMAGPGDLTRPGALETVDEIYDALAEPPLPDQTIIDPAFGGWSEGKTVDVDRETFRRLGEFRAIQRPILVSINRKNFLRYVVDRSTEDSLPVSLGATAVAVERGADVIRTHDVSATRDAAIIGRTFTPPRCEDRELGVHELDVRSRAELSRHLERIGAGAAVAADGCMRAFELRGLDTIDRALLAHLVDRMGGALAQGRPDDTAILLATPRQLRKLHASVADESAHLTAMLDRMTDES